MIRCRASAEILTKFTGSGTFYDGATRTIQDVNGDGYPDFFGEHIATPGEFQIEDGPQQPVVLPWQTFLDAADEAGISRLYGGIHIQDGDLRGRELGEYWANVSIKQHRHIFPVTGHSRATSS